jgi:hypothetical protein
VLGVGVIEALGVRGKFGMVFDSDGASIKLKSNKVN